MLQSARRLALLDRSMKHVLILFFVSGFCLSALADIQDPPSADYGPTRKLARGISNMFLGWTEIPVTIGKVNETEGNNAAATYGVIRGTGRAFARIGVGFYEALLWPIPVYKGTYDPVLRSDIPWIHRGYSEFPPEPGNETKYPYVREY
jgi:putative exosortase-associated protein (TIGR04073 family)